LKAYKITIIFEISKKINLKPKNLPKINLTKQKIRIMGAACSSKKKQQSDKNNKKDEKNV